MLNILESIKTNLNRERTLQQGITLGKTFRLIVVIFLIFMILGEVISRQRRFQSFFVAPGIGSSHRQFELQLGRLSRITQEEGKVNCIIIGSSSVLEGFNPIQFQLAFSGVTGQKISCFNFGVDGLTTAGAGVIAQVLVEKFHPQILIYGTDPRDYTFPIDTSENTSITDSPWVQYQLGKRNILGWLYEHSFLLQYQESLYQVLHLQFWREFRHFQNWDDAALRGYFEVKQARVDVSKRPDQNADTHYVGVYSELLSNFRVYPENLIGLEQVVSQRKNGVDVIVVEMPIAPGYTDFFPNGSIDYKSYIDQISEIIESNQSPFLHPQAYISFPVDGWTDYNHTNSKGTKLFSEWLGTEIGDMYLSSNLTQFVP